MKSKIGRGAAEKKGEKEKVCIGGEQLGNGGGSSRPWFRPKGVWRRDIGANNPERTGV